MVIDLILNRKDGNKYNARTFYNDVMEYSRTFPDIATPIASALDCGNETDVRKQLTLYIVQQDHNIDIVQYINSVNWL